MREHFARCFEHEWETGVMPDEVNYQPGVTPPDKTRQLCNLWKADRTIAATTLAARNAEFAARLEGAPGMRLFIDNAVWKPAGGKALLAHQDAAYQGYFDPANLTTCWMALDETHADTGTIYYARGSHLWGHMPMGGQFHAPDDWTGHAQQVAPPELYAEVEWVPIEVPRRRRGVPPRLDVPRLAAQRACRPRAARDHQPHDDHRDALASDATSTRSTATTAARTSSRSTRRSSR